MIHYAIPSPRAIFHLKNYKFNHGLERGEGGERERERRNRSSFLFHRKESNDPPFYSNHVFATGRHIEWTHLLSCERFRALSSLSSSLETGLDKVEMNSRATTSASPFFRSGESPMVGPPIFVRYTVEIFSLDSSWKARVNEFGKGLVNIRWLLNLCTRVNKYCACGTQEIREPEIVPSYLYICIYFWSYLFFHFSKLSFFFCWYLSSPTGKWFKLLNQRFVQVYCSRFYSVLL